VNPNGRHLNMIIPIITLRENDFHFNMKKLNRKKSLIVENFEKTMKPAWIVRIFVLCTS
jgi:hypothetical protein